MTEKEVPLFAKAFVITFLTLVGWLVIGALVYFNIIFWSWIIDQLS